MFRVQGLGLRVSDFWVYGFGFDFVGPGFGAAVAPKSRGIVARPKRRQSLIFSQGVGLPKPEEVTLD